MATNIKNAAATVALLTGFTNAVAGTTPDSLCVVDAEKSRATIYHRADGMDYITDERTVRGVPLTREVGLAEKTGNILARAASSLNDTPYRPRSTRLEQGIVGQYSARSEMYLRDDKKWAPVYEGSIGVAVTGWKNAQAEGYCFTASGVTGETFGKAPIVPAKNLQMLTGSHNVNIFTYKPQP